MMRILLGIGACAFVIAGVGLTVWLIVSDIRKQHRRELEKRQRMEWLGRFARDVGVDVDPKWSEGELRARLRSAMEPTRTAMPAGWHRTDTEVLETLAAETRDSDPRRRHS